MKNKIPKYKICQGQDTAYRREEENKRKNVTKKSKERKFSTKYMKKIRLENMKISCTEKNLKKKNMTGKAKINIIQIKYNKRTLPERKLPERK